MDIIEKLFLERAVHFKKLYESTAWWKFKKRWYFKKQWHESRELMVKYHYN